MSSSYDLHIIKYFSNNYTLPGQGCMVITAIHRYGLNAGLRSVKIL